MKKYDTLHSIFTGILLFSAMIFSSGVFARESILMKSCTTENNSVDVNSLLDYRGTLFRNLVANGSQQYTFFDTGSRVDYMKEAKLEQDMRNDTKYNMDNILDPKYIVDCSIRKNADKITVWLQLNSKGTVERVVEKKNIADFQMEYYLNEIALSVLNSSYKINDANAPMRAEHNIKLNSLALTQSDMEIKKIDYGNVKNEVAEKFIDTYKSSLQDANTLYAQKKFPESRKAYKTILNAIPYETKQVLSGYASEIQNRIFNGCKNEFYEKISFVDEEFNSAVFKFDMELIWYGFEYGNDNIWNFNKKYKNAKFYCDDLDDSRRSELDKIISSTIDDRLSAVKIKALLTAQDRFHSLWNESRYLEALSIFGNLDRICNKIQSKKDNTPRLEEYLRKFEKRERNLVFNFFVSKAETLERTASFYKILASAGKENLPEAENIAYLFGETYEFLDDFYNEGFSESTKRIISEATRKPKGEVYEKYKQIKQENLKRVKHRNSARYFKSKESNSLGLDIALFPFKYIFNISMSILDLFKIEPLTGVGVGTDAVIIHPSVGIGYPLPSVSTASHPSQQKFIGERNYEYFGTVVWGDNECEGFAIQIYLESETCKSNSLVRSNTKLNVWGALGIGLHFEINPLAIGNIIPELLVLKPEGRKSFWEFSDTRSFRFNYFSESIPLEDRLEWKQFDGFYTLTESINKCRSIGMELATKDQAEELMNKSKVTKNKALTINQANNQFWSWSSHQYKRDAIKGISHSLICVKEK